MHGNEVVFGERLVGRIYENRICIAAKDAKYILETRYSRKIALDEEEWRNLIQ